MRPNMGTSLTPLSKFQLNMLPLEDITGGLLQIKAMDFVIPAIAKKPSPTVVRLILKTVVAGYLFSIKFLTR